MKKVLFLYLILQIQAQPSHSQLLEQFLFKKPEKPECLQYQLPVIQTRYINSGEGAFKYKYKGEEFSGELESSAEIRSAAQPNLFITIQNDNEGNPFMIQMDSFDLNQRLVKKTMDFPKMKLINEYNTYSYFTDGNISSVSQRKCANCEVQMSLDILKNDRGEYEKILFKYALGDFDIHIKKTDNKTEYLQYLKFSDEFKEAMKLSGKPINDEGTLDSKIYKIEMQDYDSLLYYSKPFGGKGIQLTKIELLSKDGKILERFEFNSEHELSNHFVVKYNSSGQTIEIENKLMNVTYKSEFNNKGQYILQYNLYDNIRKLEYEYNEQGMVVKLFEFESRENPPSSVVLFQY
ncbi:MAG: hypothetical protein IPO72_11430 [Saprospiraceae bacterium]|nr:hypothetical protein [Candidatus Vicinibacter affinis]